MELKQYTDEEFARYNSTVGIIGKAVGICSYLYDKATEEYEKEAILSFLRKYARMRNRLDIESDDIMQYAYDEIRPLIAGDKPLLNLEYIMEHSRVGVAV
jgi:hypothetical protein